MNIKDILDYFLDKRVRQKPVYLKSGYSGPKTGKSRRPGKYLLLAVLSLSAASVLLSICLVKSAGNPRYAAETEPSRSMAARNRPEIQITQSSGAQEEGAAESLSKHDYEMLARLATAEAEDQGFEVQYFIVCVVMNRVKSSLFPDEVDAVIWQKEPVEQFTSMWNGRFIRCRTTEECYRAVDYFLQYGNLLPEDVFYFTSDGYLPGTEPYIQINNMYFSRQKEL